ncbi:MAG: glycosyltransferase family A protein [Methylocystis sp.]
MIIPTRDCRAFLGHAMSSVRLQEIDDIEIIVVDDGSSDGTDQWLGEATLRDPRIIPLQGEGKGPSFARNLALSHARGRFVALLDADDVWWPEKLARQLTYHERRPDVVFSFTDYLHVDMKGAVHGTCFEYWKPRYAQRDVEGFLVVPDAELEILAANAVGTSTVVAQLRYLQNANGFATDSHSAEDWELWLRLARLGEVACTSAVTMSYLMRPTSVTQNRATRIEAMRKIIAPYEGRRDRPGRQAWRRAMSRLEIAEAEQSRLLGAHWAAGGAHAKAFARWPDLRTARAAVADFTAACGLGRS